MGPQKRNTWKGVERVSVLENFHNYFIYRLMEVLPVLLLLESILKLKCWITKFDSTFNRFETVFIKLNT